MKNRYTLLAALAVLTACPSHAQSYGELDLNEVRARFYAHGLIGHDLDGSSAALEVPQGEGANALYSAGLWMGGLSPDSQLKLAAMKYEPLGESDYSTGPLTTDGTATTNATMMAQYDHVWEVTREQVELHMAYFQCISDPDNCELSEEFPDGYEIPAGFFDWPAINTEPGFSIYQAPFYDLNHDGDYDPSVGDAPCILGDQALYFVFNDKGAAHVLTGSQPIGVEIQAMPFAYNSGDPYLDQTIFVHYHIINQGTQTLTGTRIGIYNDFDLGCGDDDFVGTDAARNLTYVFNADDQDDDCLGTSGYGPQPPAFGMILLKGPFRDANGADEEDPDLLPSWNGTAFGDGIIDNELFGTTKSIHMYREGDACCTEPTLGVQYFHYLGGIWKDGTPLTYGGTGHSLDPGALPCDFSFPGDSDPIGAGTGGVPQSPWSETISTVPDRRTVTSAGPFVLEPGMHEDLLVAYVFARANSGGAAASVAALQARVDSVTAFAHTLPLWNTLRDDFQGGCEGVTPTVIDEAVHTGHLELFPVPAADHVQLNTPQALVGSVLCLRDATGRVVAGQRLSVGVNDIDIASLAGGMYTCEVHTAKALYTGRLVKE